MADTPLPLKAWEVTMLGGNFEFSVVLVLSEAVLVLVIEWSVFAARLGARHRVRVPSYGLSTSTNAGSPNNARPQRFAIHGEYAVACESLGGNNNSQACPGDLTDGPSAWGVRTRWAN